MCIPSSYACTFDFGPSAAPNPYNHVASLVLYGPLEAGIGRNVGTGVETLCVGFLYFSFFLISGCL